MNKNDIIIGKCHKGNLSKAWLTHTHTHTQMLMPKYIFVYKQYACVSELILINLCYVRVLEFVFVYT